MASALSIFQNIDDAIRGKQADHPGFGKGYDLEDDIAHGASSNIAPMQGMRDLFYQRTRNRRNFERIVVAFDRWLDLPTMHLEPCSSFVYGNWLMTLYQCLYVVGQYVDQPLMADKARRHLRNFRIMAAASCGWEKLDGKWFPTMCGKRCFVCKRGKGESYWYDTGPNKGKFRPPYNLDTSSLSPHINSPLGIVDRKQKIPPALAATFGDLDQWGCPPEEREVLLALINLRYQPDSPQWRQTWLPAIERDLAEGPRFYKAFQVVRTTEAVAYVFGGPGSRSTCALYAKIWYQAGRPDEDIWDGLEHWKVDRHVGWVAVDPPRRKKGDPAHARVEERDDGCWIVAAHDDEDYYHSGRRETIDGQIEVRIPGERVLQVDLRPKGVDIVHPRTDGTGPPGPPGGEEPPGCLSKILH